MDDDYKKYISEVLRGMPSYKEPRTAFNPPPTYMFVKERISALAACHGDMIGTSGNSAFMLQMFRPLSEPFVRVMALTPQYRAAHLIKEDGESGKLIAGLNEKLRDLFVDIEFAVNRTLIHVDTVFPEQAEVCEELRKIDRTHDAKNFTSELSWALRVGSDLSDRPYMVMSYAALSTLVGQPHAGFLRLDEWMRDADKDIKALNEKSNKTPDEWRKLAAQQWHLARMRSTTYSLMEEWLRSQPALRVQFADYHFANLGLAVDAFNAIPFVREGLRNFGTLKKSLADQQYSIEPVEEACDENKISRNAYLAAYALLTLKINYLQYAVTARGFEETIAPRAARYKEEFDALNLGCVRGAGDKQSDIDTYKVLRGGMLRVTSRFMIRKLASVQHLKGRDYIRAELEKALAPINLGLQIVHSRAKNPRGELAFNDVYSVSPLAEEARLLEAVRNEIQNELRKP